MRFRRRNLAWLLALGALVSVLIISNAVVGVPAAALLMLYAAAVFLSTVQISGGIRRPVRIIEQARRAPIAAKMSPDAREAVERARRRGSIYSDGTALVDVGLIATQSGRDGIAMRRTRTVTGDDDGVRPYITLKVQPNDADRNARVRFEMIDQAGETRYVHEMRTYLRDGEISVLADHHLPLAENDERPGDWDLRVYVDGTLVGMHAFSLAPSTRDRFKYLEEREAGAEKRLRASDQPSSASAAADSRDDLPVSLEDLLRSQQSNGRSSRR